jgi:proteasome lid subunit RPN8/RPN11
MIQVLIDDACVRKLKRELKVTGSREMGGVLAAENLGNGQFRIVAMSFQRSGGSVASFLRDPLFHRRFMRRFMARTGNQPERFNYFGEWHSHPSFVPLPSGTDIIQMQQLIRARDQVANFLVLLIAKLNSSGGVEASAHAFRRAYPPLQLTLISGDETKLQDQGGRLRITPKESQALRREQSTFSQGAAR